MEREFDKEIDALLRKAAKSGAAAASVLDSHLDADEISMFAENALPDSARPRVISHMADCDRCRTILSNVVTLNAEDESTAKVVAPVSSPAAVETETSSWLSRLFTTKNLAFGFGAIALVFAGFLGFAVVQNMNSTGADLAKAEPNEIQAPAAKSASNTAASSNLAETEDAKDTADEPEGDSKDNAAGDADFAQPVSPDVGAVTGKDVALPRNTPVSDGVSGRRDVARSVSRPDDKKPAVVTDSTEEFADRSVADAEQPPKPVIAASEPTRPAITTRSGVSKPKAAPVQEERMAKKKREEDDVGRAATGNKTAAKEDKSSRGRKISGKTFTRRNGVWYDSAYRNQPTKNIKRGTTEFEALDAGVRSIANQLSGTVVVVWKSKALKIQ
ncbi:MAG: hypothetical protein HKN33_07145 [Pyrinomonadaceae bacterium]|nr:hypothetical protein [Pyrinomonadaceae bacterium]